MKKLTSFIAGSLMITAIVLTPIASYADNNKNEKKGEDRNKKVSVEDKFRAKFTKKSNSNSIWNRMNNFWGKHVNADSKSNLRPIITSMTTPTVLKVGETGTWEIKATDPQNSTLTYGVDWGDNAVQPLAQSDRAVFLQTSTFTHSYAKAGKYNIKFSVSNSAGIQTTTTTTVRVIGEVVTDNRTPVIKSLNGAKTILVGQTETVTVKAYDPQNTALTYSVNWGDSTSITPLSRAASPVYLQTATFDHVYSTPGTYTATFTVTNSAGLTTSSSMNITVTAVVVVDTTAPVMSDVIVKSGLSTSTISWNTDEASTSKVFYSIGTPVDTSASATLSVSDASLVKKHSLNIAGLTANTLYHFKIVSVDGSNNMSTSSEATFATTF